ncbi:hypothetical protein BFJ63_vAg17311 [Fusarium oxysporum f. sp. narcissi]|uniref:Uncharacterized protein n=1 Tax=Fusarium oxysporum f. sp. narcissi TaxID=451672 RepID=A0A4Q2V6G0_FUSOX|nr:hypothetical protein BFJ63_vAg17311 [Fusarium oxysporum f. sp. narcissi]
MNPGCGPEDLFPSWLLDGGSAPKSSWAAAAAAAAPLKSLAHDFPADRAVPNRTQGSSTQQHASLGDHTGC